MRIVSSVYCDYFTLGEETSFLLVCCLTIAYTAIYYNSGTPFWYPIHGADGAGI